MEFDYHIPDKEGELSERANAAIAFAALAGQLSTEQRTVVYTPDGRPENVSEHSHMVGLVAGELAAGYFPELNADRVARLGNVHDILEAYVHDTPTHRITEAERRAKEEREHEGFLQLKIEYAAYPQFIALVEEYEAQKSAEARFVRMVDKLAPLLAHINDNLTGLRLEDYSPEEIRSNAIERATMFLAEYPDQAEIISIRNELSEFVAKALDRI